MWCTAMCLATQMMAWQVHMPYDFLYTKPDVKNWISAFHSF